VELTEGLRIPADERADGVDETARSTALIFQLLEAGATAITQLQHVRVQQVATAKLGGFVLVLRVEQRLGNKLIVPKSPSKVSTFAVIFRASVGWVNVRMDNSWALSEPVANRVNSVNLRFSSGPQTRTIVLI
jgi:hypothetical protein